DASLSWELNSAMFALASRMFLTVESTFAGSIAPLARRNDAIVALSCRDCSAAIAEKSFTNRFVAAMVLRRSRIPPPATISRSHADVTAFTERITESALPVSAEIPGVDGPIGTVSPGLKERGSGRDGVSATAMSPKIPFGITLAVLVAGTL